MVSHDCLYYSVLAYAASHVFLMDTSTRIQGLALTYYSKATRAMSCLLEIEARDPPRIVASLAKAHDLYTDNRQEEGLIFSTSRGFPRPVHYLPRTTDKPQQPGPGRSNIAVQAVLMLRKQYGSGLALDSAMLSRIRDEVAECEALLLCVRTAESSTCEEGSTEDIYYRDASCLFGIIISLLFEQLCRPHVGAGPLLPEP
ncbi:hypothetical protein BN1723_001094, partial [Verticillium longisporum]